MDGTAQTLLRLLEHLRNLRALVARQEKELEDRLSVYQISFQVGGLKIHCYEWEEAAVRNLITVALKKRIIKKEKK